MYTLNATFDAQVDQEQTLSAVLNLLPEGTKATLEREPVVIDVDFLGEEHIGTGIRARIGEPQEFGGTLEKIYPGEGGGLLVIVDGKPHSLAWYDTVQVIPPITAGEHTADDAEQGEQFNLTPDDFESAYDLAVQVENANSKYIVPVTYISRQVVEEFAGGPIEDDKFLAVARSVRAQLTDLMAPVAGTLIAHNLLRYDELMAVLEGEA